MGGQLPTIRYYAHHLDEAKGRLQVLCANCNWRKTLQRARHPNSRGSVEVKKERDEIFEILGEYKCGQCGEVDADVLTMDHVDGGGTAERRSMGGYVKMLQHYRMNPEEARIKLRILCRNCNWSLHLSRAEPPR